MPRLVFMRKNLIVLFVAGLLAVVYFRYNPATYFFPRCPFFSLTGYKCPGCGSQRAIHHLLHLDIPAAARENMLLVALLPYIVVGLLLEYSSLGEHRPSWRRRFYGLHASIILFVVVTVFWVLRNVA